MENQKSNQWLDLFNKQNHKSLLKINLQNPNALTVISLFKIALKTVYYTLTVPLKPLPDMNI